MSTDLSEKNVKLMAEMRAANQLMTDFVRENASDVARTISSLVPFLCGVCNLSGLRSSLNIVNITFATVALDVIKSRNDTEKEIHTELCLPVDATEMQNALYELSRFLKSFESLAKFIEKNKGLPAFRMSMSCYDKAESI